MNTETKLTREKVLTWLEDVKDPEIPVLSLIDLGVITQVDVRSAQSVYVQMTPTFAGCPAMDYMREDVLRVLNENGITEPEVVVSFDDQWSSNRITEKGRKALKQFGLAPPPKHDLIVDLEILNQVACPNCGSEDTELKNPIRSHIMPVHPQMPPVSRDIRAIQTALI